MDGLGIVVVTHQSHEVLPALLRGLQQHEPDASAKVVDSGSPGGLPDVPAGVQVVGFDNVGYGSACNAGARELGDGVHVACLNPDVRLTGPSLTELAAHFDREPDLGVVTGPVVDQAGQAQASAWGPTAAARAMWFASGFRLPRLRRAVAAVSTVGRTSTRSLDRDHLDVDGHILGGAMVVRRECWDQLGGFDEDYFLYWEDADLCKRARDLGWTVGVRPCTPIIHQAGTSSEGVLEQQRWQWYVQGAETFARKHLTAAEGRRLLAALRWGRRLSRLARTRA